MSKFPAQFSDLERLSDWALPTEQLRNSKRFAASLAQLQDVYDTLLSRADEAFTWLNQTPVEALDEQQRNLLNLFLTLAEVAFAIENYGEPAPKYLMRIDRFVPMHDAWA
jgi:dsDNA-binding SOS-regulon protein